MCAICFLTREINCHGCFIMARQNSGSPDQSVTASTYEDKTCHVCKELIRSSVAPFHAFVMRRLSHAFLYRFTPSESEAGPVPAPTAPPSDSEVPRTPAYSKGRQAQESPFVTPQPHQAGRVSSEYMYTPQHHTNLYKRIPDLKSSTDNSLGYYLPEWAFSSTFFGEWLCIAERYAPRANCMQSEMPASFVRDRFGNDRFQRSGSYWAPVPLSLGQGIAVTVVGNIPNVEGRSLGKTLHAESVCCSDLIAEGTFEPPVMRLLRRQTSGGHANSWSMDHVKSCGACLQFLGLLYGKIPLRVSSGNVFAMAKGVPISGSWGFNQEYVSALIAVFRNLDITLTPEAAIGILIMIESGAPFGPILSTMAGRQLPI